MRLFALIFLSICFTPKYIFSQLSPAGIKSVSPKENYHSKKLIENKGQWPEGVLFQTKMEGGKLWIQQKKMIFHLQDYSAMHRVHAGKDTNFKSDKIRETLVHLNFLGSNQTANIEKINPSKEYYNYFKGNDKNKWASDVHGFDAAVLHDFYQGIDMRITGLTDEVKYEFIVNSNVNPNSIKLNYVGQKAIAIDAKGNLVIETELGKIFERKPYAYQIINGKEKKVSCNFKLLDNNVTFDLGKYNENYELIIDPIMVFATYDGAKSDNFGMTATYGHDGTAYSGGTVFGNDYPNPDPLAYDINSNFTVASGGNGITDVFISKYSADGTQMLWGTFIGGGNNSFGTETVHSMICDAQDNLYFFGATSSNDFPTTTGAFDVSFNSGNTSYNANFTYNGVYYLNLGTDIYVAKLSSNGHNLLGSTYVGGNDNDGVSYEINNLPYNGSNLYSGLTSNYGDQFRGEIMLDDNNNVLIASCTRSTNFPTLNAVQPAFGGNQDGVIFKLNANFSSLIFSSFYGGTNRDACYSVKVDNSQNVVFAGGTQSNNLIGISGTWQTTFAGGTDGFVTKLNPLGNTIIASTYVGKSNYDQVFFVELDRMDNIFVLGQNVGSTNNYIPITNANYSNGNSSNFIIKFNPSLNAIIKSTRFGNGSNSIHVSPAAFLVDNCGNIYVSCWGANILQSTPLSNMPVTPGAFQTISPNGFDFYLFVLKGDFNSLLYGTYIGGIDSDEHVDGGTSRFDKDGIVYQSVCAGCSNNDDFPTSAGNGLLTPWSSTNNSTNCNNVIYKFDTEVVPVANFKADQTQGCSNFTVTMNNSSSQGDDYLWDFGNGNVDSTTFEPVITYTTPGSYTINLYVTDSICLLTDTARIVINVLDSIKLDLPSTLSSCNNQSLTIIPNTFGTATNFAWSKNPNMTNPLNNPSDSTLILQPNQSGTYYFQAGNGFCSKTDSVKVKFSPPAAAALLPDTTIGCLPLTVKFTNLSQNEDLINWNFGNGNGLNINDSTRIFTSPGTYNVLLIASDSICNTPDTATVKIQVLDTVQLYTLDPVFICNNDPYLMFATAYGTANEFTWSNFSDFSNVLNNNPSDSNIVVTNSGTYYISVSNGYCSANDSATITFNTPPIASFLPSDTIGCNPITITFDNTSVQTNHFEWDFGNGTKDTVTFEPTITYNSSGAYNVQLIITDTVCPIKDTATFLINIFDFPTITIEDSLLICNQDSTLLTIGNQNPNYTYLWSSLADFSDTLNVNNSTTIYVNSSGNYFIKVTNNGCEIDSEINVSFKPFPVSNFTLLDTLGCIPLIVQLNNNSSGLTNFVWNFGNGTFDSLNLNPAITLNQSGSYTIELIAKDTLCKTSDTTFKTITVLPQITISLEDSVSLCTSIPVTFAPSFNGNPTAFIWSSNSAISDTLNNDLSQSELLVNDPQSGFYFIQAKNATCDYKDSVFVDFVIAKLNLSLSNSICSGDTAIVSVTNTTPLISFTYNWQPSSIVVLTNNNQVYVKPPNAQYLYLTANSSNGCAVNDSIFINVSYIDPSTVIAKTSDSVVTPGSIVTLSGLPNGMNSYLWSPSNGLATPTLQSTNATIDEDITYTLTVSDGICSKNDSVSIKVLQLICNDVHLFIPNAFSPNDDNYNDKLYLRGHNIEKMIFRIFDRWGEMVFETEDQSIGWDGTFRGKKLNPDVYDYYLDVTCLGGLNEIIKGNITLMK